MMRARWISVVGGAIALAFVAGPASASCRALTEADALARASVVFEGVSQPGDLLPDGTLAKPARFSVLQYQKGNGPRVVSVTDAPGVDPMRILSGEYWVIYGRGSAEGVVQTSPCYGSYLGNGPKPFARPAASPSDTPTVIATSSPVVVGPPLVASGEVGWGVKTAAGVAGLALVMAIGYGTGRIVVGTE